jgi:hypothetical protein
MKTVVITFCIAAALGYAFHDKAKAYLAARFAALKAKIASWKSKL